MIFEYLVLIIFLVHMCGIDVKMWKGNLAEPPWITSDWSYLGGTVLLYTLLCLSWHMSVLTIVANAFLGSIVWDWLYGWLIDRDVFYPFKNWFNGIGFKSRTQRIAFDVLRFGAYVLFIIIRNAV